MKDLFIVLTLVALCLPVSQSVQVNPATDSSVAGGSQCSVYKYGPLNVPVQTQKRGKRFAIDFSCPASLYTNEFVAYRYFTTERHTLTVASVLAVAFPSDRAPPFTI